MRVTKDSKILTDEAVLAMLTAAVAKAGETGQPQCIVIVDASGETLGELRMTGAKFLSRKSARAKARTAASTGSETVRLQIGLATAGDMSGLPGGLPIRVEGTLAGGIGVGSGSGDQDIAVAQAALDAIGASL
jgi:glc operon protein GlcG